MVLNFSNETTNLQLRLTVMRSSENLLQDVRWHDFNNGLPIIIMTW